MKKQQESVASGDHLIWPFLPHSGIRRANREGKEAKHQAQAAL
jgi:hypothetical protein